MEASLTHKYEALQEMLREMESVAVAFSGGVDSTLLAKVTHDVLGNKMVAVTAGLRSVPADELAAARAWCAEEGIEHVLKEYDELEIEGYAQNPPNRCYLCKTAVFTQLKRVAEERGFVSMVDGSNLDDMGDYRPGMQALAEIGVVSPLKECGLTKADVRALSHELELPTWNAPAAACLASRFAYGEMITAAKFARVEAAEAYLHELGFSQLRVRVHGEDGTLARIEVEPADIERLASGETRMRVCTRFRELGFTYTSLDLAGFRSGAMNEVL